MIKFPYARRAQRHSLEIPCEVVCPRGERPVQHWTENLSAFGMWVPTSFPLRRGEQVVVSFRPGSPRGSRPRQEELTLSAKVVRSIGPRHDGKRRAGMGLEFCDVTRTQRKHLQRCLRRPPGGLTSEQIRRAASSGHYTRYSPDGPDR